MSLSGPRLLLVGSGLSHALLLRRARTQRSRELQLTLLAPERFAPFPFLLPELVAGKLGYREGHIDLQLLCEQAGARLICSPLENLDLDARRAQLGDGEQLEFDLISFDGDIPAPERHPEASTQSLSIEPFDRFLPGWQGMLERIYRHPKGARLALVGEDEMSIELALAISKRLNLEPRLKRPAELHLIHQGRSLLPHLPLKAQLLAAQALQERHVRVHPLFPAVAFEAGQVVTERGQYLPVDEVIWCQPSAPEAGIRQLGLATGEQGLIKINRHLQSVSHPFAFALGDLTELDAKDQALSRGSDSSLNRNLNWRLAAQQAQVLAANLACSLRGQALKTYKAPKSPLNFINLGEAQTLLVRGDTVLSGTWVSRWKHFVEQRFINQFPRP